MINKIKPLTFIFTAILLLTISSCKKEKGETYMNEGKIIGIDKGACPCCGGYQVTIDNYQYPAGMSYFLVNQFPTGLTVYPNEVFPVFIKLDWSVDTLNCFGKYINIQRISRN